MEFFRDTNIDFMRYRKHFVVVSLILVVLSVGVVFLGERLNLGVDFAGGTQITLKFRAEPEVDELRRVLNDIGLSDAQIQRFGEDSANEVLIKTPTAEDSEEGNRDRVVNALSERFNGAGSTGFDLNRRGVDAVSELLFDQDPDQIRSQGEDAAREHYLGIAEAVIAQRRQDGLIEGWEEISTLPEVGQEVAASLERNATIGEFAILGVENVGPQIGSELRRKGIMAILSSLIGMLAYIWFRFELRFGMGALVAVTHDVLIVLGLFAIAGFEFNLTTVAAFLTLVGYSVNDTVVVFDRVRENLRRSRKEPLVDLMNRSLNQTLSRTVLTSGTTLLAVGCLLALGGDVLRGFAFIITIGVVVGTYSSIYVASPFAVLWERLFGRDARSRRRTAG